MNKFYFVPKYITLFIGKIFKKIKSSTSNSNPLLFTSEYDFCRLCAVLNHF